jgi:hypothetical protein
VTENGNFKLARVWQVGQSMQIAELTLQALYDALTAA